MQLASDMLVESHLEEYMDDGRLPNEMTLDGIAKQLVEIKDQVTALDRKLTGVDGKVDGTDQRMAEGFRRVDEQLNAAKARDEDLHSLFKFGLEANDALRETVDTRFAEVGKKQDDEISLLKDVLKDRARSRP